MVAMEMGVDDGDGDGCYTEMEIWLWMMGGDRWGWRWMVERRWVEHWWPASVLGGGWGARAATPPPNSGQTEKVGRGGEGDGEKGGRRRWSREKKGEKEPESCRQKRVENPRKSNFLERETLRQ